MWSACQRHETILSRLIFFSSSLHNSGDPAGQSPLLSLLYSFFLRPSLLPSISVSSLPPWVPASFRPSLGNQTDACAAASLPEPLLLFLPHRPLVCYVTRDTFWLQTAASRSSVSNSVTLTMFPCCCLGSFVLAQK